MRQYPSIPKQQKTGKYVYVFDKVDGSNVRAEWDPEKGFWKYGTRDRLLGPNSDPILSKAIPLMDEFEDALSEIFREEDYQTVTCFFEFVGENSFAGRHEKEDEFETLLFDVWPEKEDGMIDPDRFIETYGHLQTPSVLYQGKANDELYDQVKNGELEGMSEEGVICKAKNVSGQHPDMFKVKTEEWLQKVKEL